MDEPNIYTDRYFAGKRTDTVADVFAAYGLAALLDKLMYDFAAGRYEVRIHDVGACYAVGLSEPIRAEWVEACDYFWQLPAIVTGVSAKKLPDGLPQAQIEDYDEHRKRRGEYFEALRQLPAAARRPGASPDDYPQLHEVYRLKPRQEWDAWAVINQMSAIYAYSDAVVGWHEAGQQGLFAHHLRLILQMTSTHPNRVEEAESAWRDLAKEHGLSTSPQIGALQVWNPGMGKGANRPKADQLSIGGRNEFWLLEYLKYVGLYHAGIPRVVRGSKDRKTYVLQPVNITLDTNDTVFKAFHDVMWADTAVKMDIMASLRYTQTFLRQWRAGQLTERQKRRGGQPGDYVSSLAVVFYKDLGSAHAVLNQSVIDLPHWMREVTTDEEAQAYVELLEEHERVVRVLDEARSEAYELLRTYRDFLSGHDLHDFFAFTAGYSSYLISRMERREPAPQFTTSNLEVLIMGHDEKLKPILESEGFRHIANAIRRSTVLPQHFKARNNKGPYTVRYGLGAELLRQAAYPDKFVQRLSEFMHDYNRETAQVDERYKGQPPVRRSQITTADIEQVVNLIDRYGSQTVANLLVAFGYARESRDPEPEDEGEELPEEESTATPAVG